MLVNDPPVPEPDDPDSARRRISGPGDDLLWPLDIQVRDRLRKGAAAVLLVHETGPAGYPYEVVVGSWGREQFDLPTAGPQRRPGGRRVLDRPRQGARRCSRPPGSTSRP